MAHEPKGVPPHAVAAHKQRARGRVECCGPGAGGEVDSAQSLLI
jgi:hypothetical protein